MEKTIEFSLKKSTTNLRVDYEKGGFDFFGKNFSFDRTNNVLTIDLNVATNKNDDHRKDDLKQFFKLFEGVKYIFFQLAIFDTTISTTLYKLTKQEILTIKLIHFDPGPPDPFMGRLLYKINGLIIEKIDM